MAAEQAIGELAGGPAVGPDGAHGGVGVTVGARRRAAGLTQRQLAERAGASVGAIRDLEQGRTRLPRPALAARLADALGIDPADSPGRVTWAIPSPGRSGAPLWLGVLGTLTASRGGSPLPLGEPKQRAVLAVLALSAGAPVGRDALVDALWGNDPPATAPNLVQSYVSRLRRVLDPGRSPRDDGGLLVSGRSGYLLGADARQLDLLAFQRVVGQARAARERGGVEAACGWYDRALALWRGDPAADVEVLHDWPAAVGLRLTRATVISEYGQVACGAGWHDRVLPHLRDLAARDPLNEEAHAQLMIALAGTGQQAAAIETYERLRRRLDEQIGVRPGPQLAAAHLRILRQEVPATRVSATVSAVVPAQLPPDIPDFTGRQDSLAAVTRLVTQPAATTAAVAVVAGKPGVGKTALAIRVAHRLRLAGRFPGGQLYVDLRGADAERLPLDPAGVLAGFLRALGVCPETVPEGLPERVALYRSLLAESGRRVLVVLDNAAGEVQVRPLLPAAPGCAAIVTSRRRLAGLETGRAVTLDVLSPEHAVDLLGRVAGRDRVAAEPDEAFRLAQLCGQLPLAVRIAGAKLAANPHWRLARLVERLADERRRLDELRCGDLEVRASVGLSYLSQEPVPRQAFRVLGLLDGPDVAAWALAALLGLDRDGGDEDAERRAELLVEAQLLDVAGQDDAGQVRFRLHDLLRVFARERLRAEETAANRRAALDRFFDRCLAMTTAADATLGGAGDRRDCGGFANWDAATAWLEAERATLAGAVLLAARGPSSQAPYAWRLAGALRRFHSLRGYWADWELVGRAALTAAHRAGRREAEAGCLVDLGLLAGRRRRYREATAHLHRGLKLAREVGDRAVEGRARRGLGCVHLGQGRFADAVEHVRAALAIASETGDHFGEAVTLNHLGLILGRQGDPAGATAALQRALTLHRELGNRAEEADVLSSLGDVCLRQRRLDEAAAYLQHSLAMRAALGDRGGKVESLGRLGEVHRQLGQPGMAAACYEQAARACRQIGDVRWEADCRRRLGELRAGGRENTPAPGPPNPYLPDR